MSPGTSIYELYGATFEFCNYEIAIRRTKWWQFRKRRLLRDAQWFYYPIMVNEIKYISKEDNK